jgi:hypothetical protein
MSKTYQKGKQFDAHADKLDNVIAQGRKNGMSKEALNFLNKCRGYLRKQEKIMNNEAASDRRSKG